MARSVDALGAPAGSGRTGTGAGGPWLRRLRPGGPASVRLVCLPHAGGWPNYFRPWSPLLPPYVEHLAAHYPGRESRDKEPCATRMDQLVDGVVEALEPLRDLPLVLFGHSMGASVAHEVTLRLQEAGAPPAHLVVSGRRSPTLRRATTLHLADDETFLAGIRRLGGIPDEVFEDADLRELMIGPLREDYRLIERYEPTSTAPVDAPITAMRGADDPHCSEEGALAWRDIAGRGFSPVTFPGGHFYLSQDRTGPVARLARLLADAASSAPRRGAPRRAHG
ncbi:thioesterase II family protein [Streptomyces fradiae]|uniref:thioesterase II family protein n=1 Tax=Streptomyces fradiae TaxID=1906 RepID=UPI0036C5A58E